MEETTEKITEVAPSVTEHKELFEPSPHTFLRK